MWAHARLESALNGDHLDAAVDIVDDEGGVIATLRGFRLKRTGRSTQALAGALIDTQWEAAPHTGDAAPAAGNWVVLADYRRYFDAGWKDAVRLALSAAFVGALWAMLGLGAALFHLIDLQFFAKLITKHWFAFPVTATAFALAVHLTDARAGLVRGARGMANGAYLELLR